MELRFDAGGSRSEIIVTDLSSDASQRIDTELLRSACLNTSSVSTARSVAMRMPSEWGSPRSLLFASRAHPAAGPDALALVRPRRDRIFDRHDEPLPEG